MRQKRRERRRHRLELAAERDRRTPCRERSALFAPRLVPFALADPRHQIAAIDRQRGIERRQFAVVFAERAPGGGEVALQGPRMRIARGRGDEVARRSLGVARLQRRDPEPIGLDGGGRWR